MTIFVMFDEIPVKPLPMQRDINEGSCTPLFGNAYITRLYDSNMKEKTKTVEDGVNKPMTSIPLFSQLIKITMMRVFTYEHIKGSSYGVKKRPYSLTIGMLSGMSWLCLNQDHHLQYIPWDELPFAVFNHIIRFDSRTYIGGEWYGSLAKFKFDMDIWSPILQVRDFVRSYDKTYHPILKWPPVFPFSHGSPTNCILIYDTQPWF